MVHNFAIIDTPPPEFVIYKPCIFRNTCCGKILQKYDMKIMHNGALMVCLNSLVLGNHKQPL